MRVSSALPKAKRDHYVGVVGFAENNVPFGDILPMRRMVGFAPFGVLLRKKGG